MDRPTSKPCAVLGEGRYLRLCVQDDWEFVQRRNCDGIVIILAQTAAGRVLFTEQDRAPVGRPVIEFPAGLVNDGKGRRGETVLQAARRELFEETGYRARRFVTLVRGPSSGGSCADLLTIVRAFELEKAGAGGGDAAEAITVHEVSLGGVERWLDGRRRAGCLVDPKIYAGLYFLKNYNGKHSSGRPAAAARRKHRRTTPSDQRLSSKE